MNIVKYYKLIDNGDGHNTLVVERVRLHKHDARGIAEADREMLKTGFTRKRPAALRPHVRYSDLPRRA
jgi:hypothetical protein